MSVFYESEESRLKKHLEDKHEELYLEESAGTKEQKQRDSTRTEKYANTKLFKCNKCKHNFKRTNEIEDHIQDWHCMEYDLKLNCKTGLESVVKTRSVNDALEDNNIECGTDVSANQEPFKNSENKEGEYSWFKTYNKLNCVPCEKALHEESSLVHHIRDTPDMKAWTNLKSHACETHRNSRNDLSHKTLQYSFVC